MTGLGFGVAATAGTGGATGFEQARQVIEKTAVAQPAGAIFAGSATASTGAVLTGMGVAGATAAGGGGALATNQVSKMISNVIPNSVNHIMQTKHAWDLVGVNNWSSVSNVINTVLTKGSGIANSAGNMIYSYVYNGKTVEVTTRVVDGAIRIVDAWVKTK